MLHVINPPRHQLRPAEGLIVHRRDGAPLVVVDGRPATAPAWTAVEVARALRRPRGLATLDGALRSRTCTRAELWHAARQQAGRRGIIAIRDLVPLADPAAESPKESELRLIVIDAALPTPTLQYEVIDGNGVCRRLDFAWPAYRVAMEYDGVPWHQGADALRRDRIRQAALEDVGWVVIRVVSDDVRFHAADVVARLNRAFRRARAA
jgi:REase_MTES_1575